jgi:hypothetical protein
VRYSSLKCATRSLSSPLLSPWSAHNDSIRFRTLARPSLPPNPSTAVLFFRIPFALSLVIGRLPVPRDSTVLAEAMSSLSTLSTVRCSVDGVQPIGLPAIFRVVPSAIDPAQSKIRPETDAFRVVAGDILRLSVISFDRCALQLGICAAAHCWSDHSAAPMSL